MTDAQLQALLAVADSGSFTHAARRLGLTQSAVSHALTSLEQSLRVSLIERAVQGARLTTAGERIARHARDILRLKAQIQLDAEASRRLQQGQLCIGSFGVSASRRLLPPLLQAFSARYPGVAVMVLEGSDDEVERWLHEGDVDAAFVNLPSDTFDTVTVAEDALYGIVPADHRYARASHLPMQALGEHPFIMSGGGCEMMIRSVIGNVALDVRYRIREVETLLSMVVRRMGVAVVPRLALPDAAPSEIAFVPLDTDFVRRVGLAVRKQDEEGSPARALLRMAVRRDFAATPARV